MFSAKNRLVDASKIKGGNYTTMFGNKRKVIGYHKGQAVIKKRLPARALGYTMTTPGFAGLAVGLGPKKGVKGNLQEAGVGGVEGAL